ncbi:MAG: ribosomal protein L13e [Candidatus Thorarchaeota archaeon]|nr:ribosomal protein L13e [Candidatus Thorarchaeota archaeon]
MSFEDSARPVVKSPGSENLRTGRGFSRKEISKAGLTVYEARSAGLVVDLRRRTEYSENVETIKQYTEG